MSAHAKLATDDVIGDPLFKAGYSEVFDGVEPSVDVRWSEAERLAYRRGRQFAGVVLEQGEGRLPLFRGGLVDPRTKAIYALAVVTGEVV